MEKTFSWNHSGRESLSLTLEIENNQIKAVEMNCIGCLDFMKLSQKMKEKLTGPIMDILPPAGADHSSMIWREVIGQIQEEWQLPVSHEELCHCRKIKTKQVDRAIVYGAHTIDEVRKRTSANTGCGTCKNDVEQMIGYRLKI